VQPRIEEILMKLTWYGHAAFALESEGITVLVDPYISGNPVAKVDPESLSADAIILTHAHNDHVGDTVAIARRTGATVIATFELANWIGQQGVENTVGGNHGGTIAFNGGTTKFVPAWHTSSYGTSDGPVAPGIPAGHVVRFGGRTTYFAGDTCLFLDMELIAEEDLDVAILPIGDRFTMGPKDAARAASILRAGTVIPCHFNTFPPIQQDAEAFRTQVEEETASKLLILQPGETVEIR
jgi:L-ascorbate metabolism protein UlaG (beta-lactamase superfamily)